MSPTSDRASQAAPLTAAVAWVDPVRAFIATTTPGGSILVEEIRADDAAETPYLARIVDEIGDSDRVVILGPSEERVLVEREYSAVFHRPDRIIDVEHVERITEHELVTRLHQVLKP